MDDYPRSIKAEVLINLDYVFDNELSDHRVFYVSEFRKKHQGDVMKVESLKKGRLRKIKTYFINRNGFYDRLPEGLFHRDHIQEDDNHGQAYRRNKHELQADKKSSSRKFFQPFENFLFSINLKTEKLIEHWHKNANEALGALLLNDKCFQQLSDPMRKKMFGMLATFPSIRGDATRIAFFLAAILEAEADASCEERFELFHASDPGPANILGSTTLGVDSVCGDRTTEFVQKWKFTIKTCSNNLTHFIDQVKAQNFYDIINRFFVPAGVFAEFRVLTKEKQKLILNGGHLDVNNQYLGYNVVI